MNYKALIAAAAIAAAPMAASASVVIFDDEATALGAGETFEASFAFIADGMGGDFRHTFNLSEEGTGEALVTINAITLGQFEGLVAQWLNAADDSVIATVDLDSITTTTLSTTFEDPNSLSQVLQILWTDSVKGAGFDGSVTVSTVPVPAGLLLMGTALAGLGMTRRKKA